ncbi:MAG TPA: branched-chain amino acid ABC transporter permease [Candidatus Dormibacteraeota bacterium]|nr:branched-chain amino acid ABC transporter permease [Candidatus Dormibacteraeota bacterium]
MKVSLAALAAVLLALTVPHWANGAQMFFWETVLIQMLYALSVNLLIGHAGIPSFGQAAFFGVGAYAVGIASTVLPPIALLPLAMALAAVAALAVGAIALRTYGIAFAMVTLAVGQALYTVTLHVSALGGENGLAGIDRGMLFGVSLGSQGAFWYLCACCVGLGILALRTVYLSPFGYLLRAMRDDPVRTRFLGVDVRAQRLAAFVIAGAFGGLAGGLFAYANQIVTPDALAWTRSGDPIIMALIGGMSTFWGPVVGALVYTWVTHAFAEVTPAWILYVGIVFLFFVVVIPEGILSLARILRERFAR